jgi:hypothetical protein
VAHLPPTFLPLPRAHLLAHTAPGATGLLFRGERKDHMSARYLLDRYDVARRAARRPDLTTHGLRHSALTLAGQHGATNAELQARAGHASVAAMAIYQHATVDRDRMLAAKLGDSVTASNAWANLLADAWFLGRSTLVADRSKGSVDRGTSCSQLSGYVNGAGLRVVAQHEGADTLTRFHQAIVDEQLLRLTDGVQTWHVVMLL